MRTAITIINVSKINQKLFIRIDATTEDGRLGRLINHQPESEKPNLIPKVFMENNRPHLLLVATRDIQPGKKLNCNLKVFKFGLQVRNSVIHMYIVWIILMSPW